MTIFITSLACGLAGAWFMSRYAYKFGLLDVPNNRSSHSLPTPRGGGVGILVAAIVSAIVLRLSLGFWLPAMLLSVVSFFDDRLDLSPRARLVCQFSAAFVVVASLSIFAADIDWLTGRGGLLTYWHLLLAVMLSVFIVGTANFYNFMDGINGIAGITAVVGFGLLSVFANFSSNGQHAVFSACIAIASLGFLPFNVPRASVFMGDVGSILLGFVFAASVVSLAADAADFLALSFFLFPFYADALTTLFIRWRDGEKLSQAHRRHLYQILANELKLPHWQVALGYGGVQLAAGGVMLAVREAGLLWMLLIMVLFASAFVIASLRVRLVATSVRRI